jgi:heat shock protein HslJ
MRMMKWLTFILLLAVIGCKENKDQLKQLQGRTWQLKSIKYEEKATELPEKWPELLFTDSTACYGFAGCNRFFGKYEADNNGKLVILLEGATMMSCPDMEFEDGYLKALSKVERYTV